MTPRFSRGPFSRGARPVWIYRRCKRLDSWPSVILLAVLILLVSGTTDAGATDNGKNPPLSRILSRVDQATRKLKDLSARVQQTKYFADMEETVTFQGTVAYRRPKQMRWDFTTPDPSSILALPDGVWLFIPGIKQVQKVGPACQEKIDTFFLGFEKSMTQIKKEYRLQWGGTETLPQGQADIVKFLRPQDTLIPEIAIWFDHKKGIPLRMRWGGASDETITTDFFDIKINAGISADVFDLKIPADYELVVAEE